MKPTLRLTTLALLAALLSAPPASAAQYRETFDPGKRPDEVMFGILGFGEGGTWSGRLADGQYVLTNRTDPSAVQYYYLEAPPGGTFGSLRDATVSVEVAGEFGSDPSGAGLIYRFDPATRTYWAFALTRDGYGVFKRDRGGFQEVMAGGSAAIRPGEANRLTVRPGPDGAAQFLVNDEVVGAAGGPDITGAGVGLLALGAGSFRFDEFTISTGDGATLDRAAPERAAAPAPADPRDWTAHEEPGRFALRHPPGWRVEAAADTGVVGLRGPADEEVRIWPFFVRARVDPSSAGAVLGRLAHRLAPAARWDRARAAGDSGLTAAGRDGVGRAAVTGLQWTPTAEGTAGT
ncbi:MAG TPA: hypothetical protein VFG47_14145, partial [Geminicoccaceae bacterium]|nr:hypothetical protein [Geminicoccaceae bacterium]